MVYCTKCGTKNEEDAVVCVKCGASLVTRPAWRRERKRPETECFGLPHGGAIVGLIIGVIIILVGLSQVPGLLPEIDLGKYIGPLAIIILGVLILAGALYSYSRRS
jgi:ribosomal protein L40E